MIFIGFSGNVEISERKETGFREACKKYNIECRVEMISSINKIDSDFIDRMDFSNKDAVLCSNDILAVTLHQALIHKDIRIPEDIGLTGFDNSPIRELFWDKITTIDLSTGQLGREAAVWLKNWIVNRNESRIHELVPGKFIPGTTI